MVPPASIFRFRLRTVMVVVAFVAGLLGYWMYRVNQQAAAVKAVRQLGGTARFNHEVAKSGVTVNDSPGPEWLRKTLGDQHLATLTKLSFEELTDDQLPDLRDLNLTSVEHLLLVECPISDVGLRSLSSSTFPNLRRLRLDYTQISDEGLAYLAQEFPDLEKLYVSYTDVGNTGIEHLSAMKKLVFLDLTATKVDLNGVDSLMAELPHLKVGGP